MTDIDWGIGPESTGTKCLRCKKEYAYLEEQDKVYCDDCYHILAKSLFEAVKPFEELKRQTEEVDRD